MAKLTENQIHAHLESLFQLVGAPSSEAVIQNIVATHIKRIPHGKLYKYRTCSQLNFSALQENYIWMAPASSFKDLFDCIVNVDLQRNSKGILSWLQADLPEYLYHWFKKLLLEHGHPFPVSYEAWLEGMSLCFDNDDVFQPDIYRNWLFENYPPEELNDIDTQLTQVPVILSQLESASTNVFPSILDALEQLRTQTRNTMLVYSMSESYDNRGLWENYAKDYSGFCIEYSFDHWQDASYATIKHLPYTAVTAELKWTWMTMPAILRPYCAAPVFETTIQNVLSADV